MSKQSRLDIDFSSLRTLRLVFERKSFSHAARLLGISQSAVSYTIDKLRKKFSDPLFFRQGGELVATERCREIYLAALRLLDDLDALVAPSEFDPSTSTDRVILACNFYERQLVLPPVMRKLRTVAPHMQVETISSTSRGLAQLQKNEADLLIGPIQPSDTGFHSLGLFREKYVCVMDPENPLGHSPLTMSDYISAHHAVVNYGGGWRSEYLEKLDKLGLRLNQVLNLPSPAGLDRLLVGTDMISTVASRIAASFSHNLRMVDCPCDAGFDLVLVWTARTHAAPKHIWFRQLLTDEISAHVI